MAPKPDVGKPTKLPKPPKSPKVDQVLLAIAAGGGFANFGSIEDAVAYAETLITEIEAVLDNDPATVPSA